MGLVNRTSKYCYRPNTVADLYNTVVTVLPMQRLIFVLNSTRHQQRFRAFRYDFNNNHRLFVIIIRGSKIRHLHLYVVRSIETKNLSRQPRPNSH